MDDPAPPFPQISTPGAGVVDPAAPEPPAVGLSEKDDASPRPGWPKRRVNRTRLTRSGPSCESRRSPRKLYCSSDKAACG
jgi:hypothetical protein